MVEQRRNEDDIYKGKKVLITGHTGFKGSWLALWLRELGAKVYGYALEPPTRPSLFEMVGLEKGIEHELADIRDFERVKRSVQRIKPDIVFHLAAQSLVGKSYNDPLETIQINALGTVNLMEAVRQTGLSLAMVLITSDKCYENREWHFGYRENDRLGGRDPYSASKAAAGVLIGSWRNSFFNPATINDHGVRVASARAGNVVGGGDWSKDRIVPDCIRDLQNQTFITVRNPYATRPWQHVLEPLSGYLELGRKLLDSSSEHVAEFCDAFNFGPHVTNNKSVKELVEEIIENWGSGSWKWISPQKVNYESSLLNLNIDKSYHKLHWLPKWNFEETIARTVEWYQMAGRDSSRMQEFTLKQIKSYQGDRSTGSRSSLAQETKFNF
ncbi:MAG TPA: CDP-glucose 4,6-dehydratase [Cyclobacteriaceae bacterium]|nr:CDP-glucose 4,6-dehydratase [Cyclobacteriaceae bacterium]